MIKKKIDGKAAVSLVVMCWFAYAFSYIARLNFSATMAEMTNNGLLTKSSAGLITTGFFLCYGFGQILAGRLGDKVEPRFLIFLGLSGSAACNAGIALAPPAWMMAIIWSFNGISLSLLWAPIVRLISDRIHSAQRGRACTILATTMGAGTLVAFLLSAAAIQLFGWSAPFWAASIIIALTAAAWLPVVTKIEHTADAAGSLDSAVEVVLPPEEEVPHAAVPKSLLRLFIVSGLLMLAVASGIHGVLKDCISTWTPTLLSDMFNMDSVTSILNGTLLPIFGLAGPYFTNYIFKKKMQNEIGTLVVLFAISAGALAVLMVLGRFFEFIAIVALAVTYACSIGMNMMLIGFIPMYFHKVGRVSMVTGVLNAVACIFTALVSLGIGMLVDNGGWGLVLAAWFIMSLLGGGACLLAQSKWSKFRRNLF